MSWQETGNVVSTSSDLVVRAKFGRTFHFPHDTGYKDGDKLILIFSDKGKASVLDSEHCHTSTPSTKPTKPDNIDYSLLDSIE